MIRKISKIRNLGLVFSDFTWNPSAPDFQQFNLFYGMNGSGKTTLTRLFDAMSGIPMDSLKYEIQENDQSTFHEDDAFPRQIRVFNRDYIERNIQILKSQANPISLLLGEDNKILKAQIESDTLSLNGDPNDVNAVGKLKTLNNYSQEKERKETREGEIFRDVARNIGTNAMGGSAARTYRAPNAKADFYALSRKELLSAADIDKYNLAIRQELLPEESQLQFPTLVVFGKNQDPLISLVEISTRARELLEKTVESEVINRLALNLDISVWVEQGIHLHSKYKSNACEYCGNAISAERMGQLVGHFTDADQALKQEIDTLLEYLREVHRVVLTMKLPDLMHFYPELRPSVEKMGNETISSIQRLLGQIVALGMEVKNKKTCTTIAQVLESKVETSDLVVQIDLFNGLIENHNQRTREFQRSNALAVGNLRTHYLSEIFDEVKVLDSEIENLVKNIDSCTMEIRVVQERMLNNRETISTKHRACTEINSGLKAFLGRDELTFIPHTDQVLREDGGHREIVTGYDITRDGKPALYLSEGEKTAIAFVYFIVHLNDGEFIAEGGVVVVDDPISSLDSNSLFQAFSFLKNAVKDCGQVFILTHHFDFLKLLLNWRKIPKKTSFYMIPTEVKGTARMADIVELDKLLLKYESEYQYLFKLLKRMRNSQDGTLAQAYPVPNIARKVWDTFLMFRVPNGENPYGKMEYLKSLGYNAQKLDSIYKFTNDQSHITGAGFNPALVPETQKVIANLFEMIEEIDPKHYGIIDGVTN